MRRLILPSFIFFLIFTIYSLKVSKQKKDIIWHDAPGDVSFLDINTREINASDSIPVPKLKQKIDSNFYLNLLDKCSEKFKVDTSSLKNSILRIPQMTREIVFKHNNKCQTISSEQISDSNCTYIAECLKSVVKIEQTGLGPDKGKDDQYKLYRDVKSAVYFYESFTKEKVVYYDLQDFSLKDNWKRFINSGSAQFNPDTKQTQLLKNSILNATKYDKLTQAELIHEAIIATNGNLTMGMGSLSQIFHDERNLIFKTDMVNADGKNYYRFVGLYIGLHDTYLIKNLGTVVGYANIIGNPIVYAAGDLIKATDFALQFYGLKKKKRDRTCRFKTNHKKYGTKWSR